jgi:glycosyltransferase involved in cell wall biosynthesis
MRAVAGLRRLVRGQRIHLVVSNTPRAAYLASFAVFGLGLPMIWWVRDFAHPRALLRLLRPLHDRIAFASRAVLERYTDPGDRKAVLWYDLQREPEPIAALDVVAERRVYGFQPGDVVLGFMGRLVEEKGGSDVVRAFASLAPAHPRLRLLIVGTGAGQPGDDEPRLRSLVAELGLADRVKFAGWQDRQALYYALFDVFVLATRDHEALSSSVLQAMMAGKPVVATAVGGVPELVAHERTGLLVPPGDAEGMAAAIERLLADDALRHRLADRARAHVMQHHLAGPATRGIEKVYAELV